MSKKILISDELAERLEALRADRGFASIDEAAEALLTLAMAAEDLDEELESWSDEELRALIAEADASPAADWDAAAFRAEIHRRTGSARR
jgi:Arc/MetJ-type ribon-helix-helix transcriptional regulator